MTEQENGNSFGGTLETGSVGRNRIGDELASVVRRKVGVLSVSWSTARLE